MTVRLKRRYTQTAINNGYKLGRYIIVSKDHLSVYSMFLHTYEEGVKKTKQLGADAILELTYTNFVELITSGEFMKSISEFVWKNRVKCKGENYYVSLGWDRSFETKKDVFEGLVQDQAMAIAEGKLYLFLEKLCPNE